MFKFLKRKFIKDSKVKKYLLYAFGEILLVMIGILLALQVNSYRESIKNRDIKRNLYIEIKTDLIETKNEIESDLKAHIKSLHSGSIFKEYILRNEVFHDSILKHFYYLKSDRQVYPKTSGFDFLKVKGIDFISNDSLRKGITNLYQLEISRLVKNGRDNPQNSIEILLEPYYLKYTQITNEKIREVKISGLKKPIAHYKKTFMHYNKLRKDNEFLLQLQKSFVLRRRKIRTHIDVIEKINTILKKLDKNHIVVNIDGVEYKIIESMDNEFIETK